MLSNAYLLAKIGADTAENEQHFAEILPIGRRVADRRLSRRGFDASEGSDAVQLAARAAVLARPYALGCRRKSRRAAV